MKKGTQKPRSSVFIATLFVLLIAIAIFLGFNVLTVFQKADQDQISLQLASEIRASSYRLVSLSRDATAGKEDAFAELQSVVDQTQQGWQELNGSVELEVSPSKLRELEIIWLRTKTNAERLVADKETILFLNQVAATLNDNLPQLQQEHTQVVEILLENRAPADQVAVAQAQSWRAERVGRNIDKMLAGGAGSEKSADQFNRDANLFGRVLNGMSEGDIALGISRVSNGQARASLERIAEQFEFVNSSIRKIFEATPVLFAARQANNAILDDSLLLQEKISQLSNAVAALPKERDLTNQTALIAGVVAISLLIWIGLLIYAGTRNRLRETADTNDQNQQAILRLLDEIGDLGDGDLTSHATVTEDFTGAIADSINYAIDQLRILVAQIQDASENVSAAADKTRANVEQLTSASQNQAQEIAGASAAIKEMAVTIDQVSANAAESAVVADRSVSIAKAGAGVVQNTIAGMGTIREQIQDTSKRIKRLGESSQEIGDIVSLINDIADQTNILALNAAIQASMAGDAGRGFAVVADEVQRLAERSAGATKQIASLVKTIQTDTNEAVISMEQTTSEVVKGAERAQDAGVALEEIETVSASLAELIQDISTAARHQTITAGRISNTMNVIQDITSQTLAGTGDTSKSISELTELAVELRGSVSGFRLPGEDVVIAEAEAIPSDDFVDNLDEVEESVDVAVSNETLAGEIRADAEQVRADLDDEMYLAPELENLEKEGELATDTLPKMTVEALADELANDIGDWGTPREVAGMGNDSELAAANGDDNFTIDVDELDLAEIEAELGLTDEDLANDKEEPSLA